jgi:GAF domain-containing protein
MTESNLSQNLAPNPEEETRLLYKDWREQFIMPLLIGCLILGVFVLIPAVQSAAANLFLKIVFIATYVLLGIVTVIHFPYFVRVSVFLLVIHVLGLSELLRYGILGDCSVFYLAFVVFATLLHSPRAGIVATVISTVTLAISGWLMLSERIMPFEQFTSPALLQDWISGTGMIILFGAITILGFQRLEQTIFVTRKQIDTSLNIIQNERNNLEKIVIERTQQLRQVNGIGNTITAVLDPDELLDRAVNLISNEFNCYYTAIFLTDATGQWAELKAATGDAGRVLRDNKHRLDINGKNAVATAIRTRQSRILSDAGPSATMFDNPLLPYTHSQIALPLAVGERVIGALEMHSTKENAFSQQEAEVYQSMANQVAIALENSRLFTEAQQSINELSTTQQQYLQGVWLSLAAEQKLEHTLGDRDSAGDQDIEVPLTLRDQIIGQISMAGANEWTPEQKKLIESIATQAALALENARLVEESQSIAVRERLANEVISKIWASTTIDSILQTTVRELGRALEATEVNIEVSMEGRND